MHSEEDIALFDTIELCYSDESTLTPPEKKRKNHTLLHHGPVSPHMN